MIEIFKTNVRKIVQARKIINLLMKHLPGSKINFDLDDCDKILKIAGIHFISEEIIVLVKEEGFECEILE